jgi:hypothetical protein
MHVCVYKSECLYVYEYLRLYYESQDETNLVFQMCSLGCSVRACVFIGMSAHTCMSICTCTVLLKK